MAPGIDVAAGKTLHHAEHSRLPARVEHGLVRFDLDTPEAVQSAHVVNAVHARLTGPGSERCQWPFAVNTSSIAFSTSAAPLSMLAAPTSIRSRTASACVPVPPSTPRPSSVASRAPVSGSGPPISASHVPSNATDVL